LKAAAEVDGDNAKIETQLGRIAMLQSDLAQALAHYQHALALDPSDTQAQMGLADFYRQQEKPEESAKYLRKIVESDPLNAEAHYKLSQADRQLRLTDESKKEMQLFLQIRAAEDKVKQLYREMLPNQPSGSEPSARE
jgi:tetratricopeptide (TPR) repeat protein